MRKLALGCLLLAAASVASASTTFVAKGSSSGGDSVYAEADFTFGHNLLTLTLTNLLANPGSVGQNISDFRFTIASTPTGSLASATAPKTVTVADDKSYAISSIPVDPGWAFTFSSGGVFYLNGLAGSQNPAYTIIGPPGGPTYSNAGGSIANTGGPHNPFLYQTATWVFNIVNPGSSVLSITNVNFSFGTASGNDFACDASHSFCASTPEPGSWLLLGSGLAALLLFARKRTT